MNELTTHKNQFCISTNKSKLDIDSIHDFLSTKAYWCLNIPKEKVRMDKHCRSYQMDGTS